MNTLRDKKHFIESISEDLIRSNENMKVEITITIPNVNTNIIISSFILYNDIMIVVGIEVDDKKCIIDSAVCRRSLLKDKTKIMSLLNIQLNHCFDDIKEKIFKGFDFLHNINSLDIVVDLISIDKDNVEMFSDKIADNYLAVDYMKEAHFDSNKECVKDASLDEVLSYLVTEFITNKSNMCEIEFINKEYGVTLLFIAQKTILCGKYTIGIRVLRVDKDYIKLQSKGLPINDIIHDLDIMHCDIDINKMNKFDILNNTIYTDKDNNLIAEALSVMMSYYNRIGLSYTINIYKYECIDEDENFI